MQYAPRQVLVQYMYISLQLKYNTNKTCFDLQRHEVNPVNCAKTKVTLQRSGVAEGGGASTHLGGA